MIPSTVSDSVQTNAVQAEVPMPRQQLLGSSGPLVREASAADARTVRKQTLSAAPFVVAPLVQTAITVDEGLAHLQLANAGPHALRLAVHRHHLVNLLPARYDLMPGQSISVDVPAANGVYDIAVHGPDGFLRTIAGDTASTLASFEANLTVTGASVSPVLSLDVHNGDRITRIFKVSSRIGAAASYRIAPGSSHEVRLHPLQHAAGWYDLTVTVDGVSSFSRRFAGHLASSQPMNPAQIER
jgi:phospholipase C